MTTVIDLGPVDWGRIWQDRAGLVSVDHLKELNSISNAVHSSAPGYWRNLFASFPEIVSNAGQIARLYVRPGQEPKSFVTTQPARMPEPASMNKQVEDKRNQTIREVEEMRAASAALHPVTRGFMYLGQRVKDEVPIVKKAVDLVEKVGDTAANLVDAASNIAGAAKDLTGDASDFTKDAKEVVQKVMLAGGVIAAAYVYSLVK